MYTTPPYSRAHWTEDDLVQMIGQRTPEDLHLELKDARAFDIATDAGKNEVTKDVSAMANADGGTIVYGIGETRQHTAGSLRPIKSDVDIDTVYRILNSNIRAPIANLKVSKINLSREYEGYVALIIDVPKATTRAPHQARDRKYYRRYGVEVLGLDHHEIADLFRRAEAPELRVWLREHDLPEKQSEEVTSRPLFWVPAALMIVNTSSAVCTHALVDIMFDARLTFFGIPEDTNRESGIRIHEQLAYEGSRYRVAFSLYQRQWHSKDLMPLFKGSMFFLTGNEAMIGFQPGTETVPHFIGWRCRAPLMEETKGFIAFHIQNDQLIIEALPWSSPEP